MFGFLGRSNSDEQDVRAEEEYIDVVDMGPHAEHPTVIRAKNRQRARKDRHAVASDLDGKKKGGREDNKGNGPPGPVASSSS